MVGVLVLLGRQSAEAGLDPARVVPAVDVAEQGVLGLSAGGERGARPVHELDLERRPQVLGQRVVEAVPGAAGRGCHSGVDEALGEPQRGVLPGRPLSLWKINYPARTSRERSAWLSTVSTSVVVTRGSMAQPTMGLAK